MYLIKTPWLLKKCYPKELLWNKVRDQKTIYLTFDDGPIPIVTPFVLKTLKTFNAKATFFCIGDNIVKNTEIFEQIKTEGHTIGNHTFNHLNGWHTKDDIYLDNIQSCQGLTKSILFRPPYGRIKKSQIRKLMALGAEDSLAKVKDEKSEACNITYQDTENEIPGDPHSSKVSNLTPPISKIVMWDVLSGDFDTNLSPGKCLDNVIKHTESGSIVVFHDSLKAWERLQYALPRAMEYFSERGYHFKRL